MRNVVTDICIGTISCNSGKYWRLLYLGTKAMKNVIAEIYTPLESFVVQAYLLGNIDCW